MVADTEGQEKGQDVQTFGIASGRVRSFFEKEGKKQWKKGYSGVRSKDLIFLSTCSWDGAILDSRSRWPWKVCVMYFDGVTISEKTAQVIDDRDSFRALIKMLSKYEQDGNEKELLVGIKILFVTVGIKLKELKESNHEPHRGRT